MHTLQLGHLGPTHLYILGIDLKNGLLVSDGVHAIPCHLGPQAQEQMTQWLKDSKICKTEEIVG